MTDFLYISVGCVREVGLGAGSRASLIAGLAGPSGLTVGKTVGGCELCKWSITCDIVVFR